VLDRPGVDRLAIFDLDNTLVDRSAAFAGWAAGFAERWGLGPEALPWLIEEDRDGFAPRRTVFERAQARFGLTESVDQLVAAYSQDYLNRFRPDPAVQDGLARLREAGWRLAVATNGAPTQHTKIENAGLTPWFDAVCVSEELGFAKPDRRIFEAACSAAGLERAALGRSWMIGDTAAADIRGAHELGMRSVWLHRGRDWMEPAFRPDVVVDSIDRAVEHLLANG
jgi:HAD superfamily hydrolase (TIGR01549 family)